MRSWKTSVRWKTGVSETRDALPEAGVSGPPESPLFRNGQPVPALGLLPIFSTLTPPAASEAVTPPRRAASSPHAKGGQHSSPYIVSSQMLNWTLRRMELSRLPQTSSKIAPFNVAARMSIEHAGNTKMLRTLESVRTFKTFSHSKSDVKTRTSVHHPRDLVSPFCQIEERLLTPD